MDQEASVAARVAGVREAEETSRDDPALRGIRYEELKRVVWLAGNPEEVRVAAVEELVEFQERLDETGAMFVLRLPTEPSARVVEAIAREGADLGWQALAPAIVERWVSPARQPDRGGEPVEAQALKLLFPDRPVEATVFEVFAHGVDGEALDAEGRRAAWDLLNRLDPDGADLLALLQDARLSGDALVEQLRRAAVDLSITPRTQEELAWLERLGSAQNASFWSEARGVVAGLSGERREGLELRHLPVLVYASRYRPAWLAMSSGELESQIEMGLALRERTSRAGGRETLHAWRRQLCWADRLSIAVANDLVADRGAVGAFFAIADQDMDDTSTEHGGLVAFDGQGAFRVDHYPPRANERFGDKRFVASRNMIRSGDQALFHFHMHAQKHRNGGYAGPSGEDYENARRLGRSSLVLTFVSGDGLNVDYYQGDGSVVDLGTITRSVE